MRPVASVLALGLALVAGPAPAQALGFDSGVPRYDRHGQYDRDGAGQDGYYDDARVLRVDPVFDDGRVATSDPRCRTRQDSYVEDDGRDGYRDPYGADRYGRDGDAYDRYGSDRRDANGRMVATVVGGVVGAVLGSKVGGGSGRYATSALGTMVGGMAGREIYDAARRDRYARTGQVTVCDPVPVGDAAGERYGGVEAYDVTYEYGGRQYSTRTGYHPGDTIRVRVDVRPE
ncbi:glycine zipper 2TM domain-containing protein [Luteimonas sp. MC1895]|uniref:glycine zipper 2TM domain-containing protein n=1 Tax=Luteimonas sp. MC1895 TaxID=2819513 RepID=UPI0018F0BC9C|nr:glycine zipper 2TM domain-containing protein [Luteimonas sp. MC1895]MBJ6978739.1 glycine zipper 2TM domain-containing protein [Luteimonas sp. MC1895]